MWPAQRNIARQLAEQPQFRIVEEIALIGEQVQAAHEPVLQYDGSRQMARKPRASRSAREINRPGSAAMSLQICGCRRTPGGGEQRVLCLRAIQADQWMLQQIRGAPGRGHGAQFRAAIAPATPGEAELALLDRQPAGPPQQLAAIGHAHDQ